MNKGFSGATIEIHSDHVVKRGERMYQQALICQSTPMHAVCPKILESSEGSYTMERLNELDVWYVSDAHGTLEAVRDMLSAKIWSIRCRPTHEYWWEDQLIARVHGIVGFDISSMLRTLWLDQAAWHNIHGDPTLSNTMMRGQELVLIDPVRSGYIPMHWTVDMGKLLQSAIGWERILCGWQYDSRLCITTLLRGLDAVAIRRSWFWCMINCVRIIPYAETQGKEKIKQWALSNATALWRLLHNNDLREETICNTLSI